jgi:cobalamin biosynthesis Mg chelatase CobN
MSYRNNTPREVDDADKALITQAAVELMGATVWDPGVNPTAAKNMARLLRSIRDWYGADDERYEHARDVAAVLVSGALVDAGLLNYRLAPYVVDAMVDRVTNPVVELWADEDDGEDD